MSNNNIGWYTLSDSGLSENNNNNNELSQEDLAQFNADAMYSASIQAITMTYIQDPAFQHYMSQDNLDSLEKQRSEYSKDLIRLNERNSQLKQEISDSDTEGIKRNSLFDTIESIKNQGEYEKNRAKIRSITTYKTADAIKKIKVIYTLNENNKHVNDEEIIFPGHSNNIQQITNTLTDNEYLQKVIIYHNRTSTPHSVAGVLFKTVDGSKITNNDGHSIIADNHINNIKNLGKRKAKEFCLDTNHKSFDAHYVTNPNKNSEGYAQPSHNHTISDRTQTTCEINDEWTPASILNSSENERVRQLVNINKNTEFGAYVGGVRKRVDLWNHWNNHRHFSPQQRGYRSWVNSLSLDDRRGSKVWRWLNGDKWEYQNWNPGEPNGTYWNSPFSEPLLNMWKYSGTWNDMWVYHPHFWRKSAKSYPHGAPALFSRTFAPIETETFQVEFNQQIVIKNGKMESEFKTVINTVAITLFNELVKEFKAMEATAIQNNQEKAQEYVNNNEMIKEYNTMITRIDKQINSIQTLLRTLKGLDNNDLSKMISDRNIQGFSNISEDKISELIYLIQDNSVNIILILLISILLYKFYCKK